MNEKEFISLCKKTVAEYANEHLDKTDGKQITADDVFVVWMCKTLQNSKALARVTLMKTDTPLLHRESKPCWKVSSCNPHSEEKANQMRNVMEYVITARTILFLSFLACCKLGSRSD